VPGHCSAAYFLILTLLGDQGSNRSALAAASVVLQRDLMITDQLIQQMNISTW
jgi:hypothetical protein